MRGLLLLLSALLLLVPTEGNVKYEQLTQSDKTIVDNAIVKANGAFSKVFHLDFATILRTDERKGMLHVLLKPTSCKKMESVHREDCVINNNARPHVSCVACKGNMSCLLLKEANKIKKEIEDCLAKSAHHTAGAHSLFQTGQNEEQIGCLGCI